MLLTATRHVAATAHLQSAPARLLRSPMKQPGEHPVGCSGGPAGPHGGMQHQNTQLSPVAGSQA